MYKIIPYSLAICLSTSAMASLSISVNQHFKKSPPPKTIQLQLKNANLANSPTITLALTQKGANNNWHSYSGQVTADEIKKLSVKGSTFSSRCGKAYTIQLIYPHYGKSSGTLLPKTNNHFSCSVNSNTNRFHCVQSECS